MVTGSGLLLIATAFFVTIRCRRSPAASSSSSTPKKPTHLARLAATAGARKYRGLGKMGESADELQLEPTASESLPSETTLTNEQATLPSEQALPPGAASLAECRIAGELLAGGDNVLVVDGSDRVSSERRSAGEVVPDGSPRLWI